MGGPGGEGGVFEDEDFVALVFDDERTKGEGMITLSTPVKVSVQYQRAEQEQH